MVKIVWTEISIDDLKDIFDYIAKDSFRYASITVNKIYLRTQLLIQNPNAEKMVPESGDATIRELISENYRIIYKIKSAFQGDILRVYHSSRFLKTKDLQIIYYRNYGVAQQLQNQYTL